MGVIKQMISNSKNRLLAFNEKQFSDQANTQKPIRSSQYITIVYIGINFSHKLLLDKKN